MADRHGHVNHAEYGKNRRLYHGHERSQNVKHNRDHDFRQVAEDLEHQVIAEHVAVKTNGKRNRSKDVGKHFDHEKQRRKKKHRPHELLEVTGAVLTNTEIMVGDKNDEP